MKAKKDSLKARKLDWSLLTIDMREALQEVTKVLHYAAYDKPNAYGPRNWVHGKKDEGFKRELKSAIERHRTEAEAPYPYDFESKLHHRAHIIASELFLLSYDIAASLPEAEDCSSRAQESVSSPEGSTPSNDAASLYDWDQAPEWAMWAATDGDDETANWYDSKPIARRTCWWFACEAGRSEYALYRPDLAENWRESLEERPKQWRTK